jgi:hypothetical protein
MPGQPPGAIGMMTNNIASNLTQTSGVQPTQAQDIASTISGYIAKFAHEKLGSHPDVQAQQQQQQIPQFPKYY